MYDCFFAGTQSNVQPIIPYVTDTYMDEAEQVEESIALCTLKQYPNKIEHTIQWARDIFEKVRHFHAAVWTASLPMVSLYQVVSLPWCILPYKYRGMLFKLMKLFDVMGSRNSRKTRRRWPSTCWTEACSCKS